MLRTVENVICLSYESLNANNYWQLTQKHVGALPWPAKYPTDISVTTIPSLQDTKGDNPFQWCGGSVGRVLHSG